MPSEDFESQDLELILSKRMTSWAMLKLASMIRNKEIIDLLIE